MRYWAGAANRPMRTKADHSRRQGSPPKNSGMIIMAEDKKALLLLEEIRELQEKMVGVG